MFPHKIKIPSINPQRAAIPHVTIVRTILNDCKEKLLVIFYQDDKGSELVKYVNSN